MKPAQKKGGKSKPAFSAFAALGDDDDNGDAQDDDDEEEEAPPPRSSGKKKGKKAASAFAMLEEEEGEDGADDNGSEAAAPRGLLVARIAKIAPHPKADRLKLCTIDLGDAHSPLTVVCGAANAAMGVMCILAPVGSKLPGTGVTLEPATIRGVESKGMLCGTGELGWPAHVAPENHLVVLASSAVPGTPAPTTPPPAVGGDEAAGGDGESDAVFSFAKKGKKKTASFAALAGEEDAGAAAAAETPDAADASGEAAEVFSFAKKGGKGKTKAAEQQPEAEPASEAPEAGDAEVFSFAKKGAKGKKASAATATDGAPDEEAAKVVARLAAESAARAKFEADRAAAAEKAEKEKQQKKGKPIVSAAAVADDDIDAILAALEAPSEPKADAGGKKGKKKGKKGDKGEAEAVPTDAPTAPPSDAGDAAVSAPAVSAADGAAPTGAAPPADEDGDGGEDDAALDSVPEKELTAAQRKKLKKRQKEKEAKAAAAAAAAAGDAAPGGDAPPAPTGGKDKKDGKAPNTVVRRMQEALAKRQAEEAAASAAEEAARKAAEEEEAKLAAAEAAEAERKRLKKEREKQKKEELRKQGKLLTEKQKEEKRRLEMFRAQLLASKGDSAEGGDAADAEAAAAAAAVESAKPAKVVYGKKKKAPAADKADKGGEEPSTGPEEEEPAVVDAPQEQAEAAVADEPDVAAVEPAKEAEAEAEEEGGWDDTDWESAEVKLPARKKGSDEEEEVEAKPKQPANTPAAPQAAKTAKAAPKAVLPSPPAAAPKAAAPKASLGAPKLLVKAQPALAGKPAPSAKAAAVEEDDTSESSSSDSDDSSSDDSSDSSSSSSGSDSDSSSDSSESDSDSSNSSDSDENSDSDEEEEVEDEATMQLRLRKEASRARRRARTATAVAAKSTDHLRSPVVCILGHVDTGKTKILDNIRRTNVQDGEAGGITQQIGATFMPAESLAERTSRVQVPAGFSMRLPGLLVIDTPGHESFTNLRSRGSGLCDIAILVVDIMHGLEQQTIESLNLLRMRKTPFLVALNKCDRMYDWKAVKDAPFRESLEQQPEHARSEFYTRWQAAKLALAEQGLNTALYWDNPDVRTYVNVVPTSAITGEGIPDLLFMLANLTQSRMADRLAYVDDVQCTVLEVKALEGLGTTVDVVLLNGILREGDTIVVAGLHGPLVAHIRALLTPHPMREMRVKSAFLHHKEVRGAQGVKIVAQGLETAVAGTQLLVLHPEDELEDLKDEVVQDMKGVLGDVDKTGVGVYVQASTLGSLEALLAFLRDPRVNIPVAGINIGPVHKRDVMGASVMLERKRKEYATILAFDVKVEPAASELAAEMGIKIFTADIIYHLFDQFTAYMDTIKEEAKKAAADTCSFPCVLRILPTCVFNKKDPIVLGCEVVSGIARIGTVVCVPGQGYIDLGRIASMEHNHKAVEKAVKGQSVAMKIQPQIALEATRMYGRHFDHRDEIVSRITRRSIDLLKEHFKDELAKDDWQLLVQLKKRQELHYNEII